MSGTEDSPTLLAAEYALGCLDLAEMRRAEALIARDPAFAQDVAAWEQWLGPLGRLVQPVSPPARFVVSPSSRNWRNSNAARVGGALSGRPRPVCPSRSRPVSRCWPSYPAPPARLSNQPASSQRSPR